MSANEINDSADTGMEAENASAVFASGAEIDEDAEFDKAVSSIAGGVEAEPEKESGESNKGDTQTNEGEQGEPEQEQTGDGNTNEEWLKKYLGGDKNNETAAGPAAEPEPEKKPEQTPPAAEPAPAASPAAGKFDMKALMEEVISDAKNDKEHKQFFDSFGDDANMMSYFAAATVKKMLEKGMLSVSGKQSDTGLKEFDERLKSLEAREMAIAQEEQRAKEVAWDREVEKEIPDWREIIRNDKKFPEWFEKQSSLIKNCLSNASQPSDVVDALKKFKDDTGRQTARMNGVRGIYNNPANDRNTVRRMDNSSMVFDEDSVFEEAASKIKKGR